MIQMNPLLLYMFASFGMMGAFYLYYILVLKNASRFTLNRVFLLGSLVISVVAPLAGFTEVVSTSLAEVTPATISLPTILVNEAPDSSFATPSLAGFSLPLLIYLSGVGLSLFIFIRKLIQMARFLKGKPRIRQQGYSLVNSQGQVETASFFQLLIWNDLAELTEHERKQVLAHELCHIRQLHSLDLLGIEFLRILFWFNPFLYLYRTALRQTHEFLADQAAIEETGGKGYAHLLLRQVLEGPSMPPAHPIVVGSFF